MVLATCQVKRTVPLDEPNALRQRSHPHTKQQTFRINLRGREGGAANPCQLSGRFGHSGFSRIDRCDVGCGHTVPCRADTAVSQAVPNSRSHTRWTTLSDGESVLGGFCAMFLHCVSHWCLGALSTSSTDCMVANFHVGLYRCNALQLIII
jgi:hypothetical protein